MNRDLARTLVLALLAVLALSVAAATLTETVSVGDGSGLGSGSGSGFDSGSDGASGPDADSNPDGISGQLRLGLCLPWLRQPLVQAALLAGLLAAGGVAWYASDAFLVGLSIFFMAGIPVGLIYFLLATCPGPSEPFRIGLPMQNGSLGATTPTPGGGGGSGDQTVETVAQPEVALFLLLAVAVVVAVALLVVGTGSDEPETETEVLEPPEPDVAAAARAAGAAADRIGDAGDVENEVFQAWREMTTHLDVADPETATPAEFADAAVDAGMARRDVAELTEVFEAVRYGGREPTADRVDRAVGALRRIESTYADADPADWTDDATGSDRTDGGERP
ncbi:MAG: DUF4129 domain-containing protein [Halolamina sp.]